MRCPGDGPPEYRTENIRVLTVIETIRLRPGMFVGNTDSRGLHQILFDLVVGSLGEIARCNGRLVQITLRADGSVEIADDGVPFYTDEPPRGQPPIEFIFTRWYGHQPNPQGRNWLAYAIANALSERLTVFARLPGSVYQHAFRRGTTHAVVQSGGPPDDRGLTVRFRPDPDIFGAARFDADTIRERLRQYAFLHSGVRITFSDETTGTRDEFEFADGIREYVQSLNANRTPLHADMIVIRGEEGGVRYEVGLQWCEEEDEVTGWFSNDRESPLGGTHVTGARTAITRSINDFIRAHFPAERVVKGDDTRGNLTAVVSVRMTDPQYEGALRQRLNNPEIEGILSSGLRQPLTDDFETNRTTAELIVRAALTARDTREGATAVRRKKRS